MTPEIKDFTIWQEAQRWLAKHGWGLGLIEEQKVLWEEANSPTTDALEVKATPEATAKPAIKTATKPVAKAIE